MADQTMLTVIVISFMIFLFFRYCLGYENLMEDLQLPTHPEQQVDIHRMVMGD